MHIETARTPELIASEINDIKEESDKMMLYNSVEIGRRLTEAKELIPHGEWGKWLKESVSYSQRTANYLMQIGKEFGPELIPTGAGGRPNSQPVANLGFTQAVILLGIPAEERAQFMTHYDVGSMSKRELQQTVYAWDQPSGEKAGTPEPQAQAAQKQVEPEKTVDKIPDQTGGLIPVVRKIMKPEVVRPIVNTNAESIKYDTQYAMHRDNMLIAYREILKTFVAQDRIDPARKEINRAEMFKMLTNMAETLKEYPPVIRTNLKIQASN